MDAEQLKNLETVELVEKVGQLKQELFHYRSQLAMGRIENPMKIRETRRNIARVQTVLRQKG